MQNQQQRLENYIYNANQIELEALSSLERLGDEINGN